MRWNSDSSQSRAFAFSGVIAARPAMESFASLKTSRMSRAESSAGSAAGAVVAVDVFGSADGVAGATQASERATITNTARDAVLAAQAGARGAWIMTGIWNKGTSNSTKALHELGSRKSLMTSAPDMRS